MYRAIALVMIVALILIGCSNDFTQPTSPTDATDSNDQSFLSTSMSKALSVDNIISATLYLNVSGASGRNISVHRATQAWDESTVTYTNFGESFDPTAEDSFLADAIGWRLADVTPLVAAYLDGTYENYGFLLHSVDFNFPTTFFNSSEAYNNQPYLQICYGDPAAPACLQIMADHDSFIWELLPDDNYGSSEYLRTGADYDAHPGKYTLIQFPLPSPPPLAAIGDFVWYDDNEDGIQDIGEVGLEGVIVNLYDCQDLLISSMLTDLNGYYLFSNLTAGDYYVEFEAPDGYMFSPLDQGADDAVDSDVNPITGRTICTTLDEGETDLSWDAGLYLPVEDCGDCDGRITELTLSYLGDTEALVEVFGKGKKNLQGPVLFSGQVLPGGSFNFVGFDKNGTLGTEITVFVDGSLNTNIHTSCSQPIYIGMVSGDFEILDGYSRFGGKLCLGDGGNGETPSDCDGKITELTLEYMGDAEVLIEVMAKGKRHSPGTLLFSGQVLPGASFNFVGLDKNGTMGTEISVYVDGELNTMIHTSCSQPIYIGMVSGDFEILDGYSRFGGQLNTL